MYTHELRSIVFHGLLRARRPQQSQLHRYAQIEGSTADQMRFLYMNEAALAVWAQMQKDTKIMGRLHRPPRGATLSFGMPFSE